MTRHIVCLTFDFDTQSGFIARGLTTQTPLSRGEFGSRVASDRILGMPRANSDALLEELYSALYDPAHVYEHVWHPGDLVIWDNLIVQHARPEPNDRARTLRRFHVSETDLTEDYLRIGRERGYV